MKGAKRVGFPFLLGASRLILRVLGGVGRTLEALAGTRCHHTWEPSPDPEPPIMPARGLRGGDCWEQLSWLWARWADGGALPRLPLLTLGVVIPTASSTKNIVRFPY